MAKTQSCVLLSIGLLATGIGRPASPSDWAPTWCATPADTARGYGPDVQWNGHPLWTRRDPRSRRRAGPESVQALPGSLSASIAWGDPSGASVEPVADPNLWGANGNVIDFCRSGNTLYIAGSFRSVGENSGGFVPLDVHTGKAVRPFPKVAGSVVAIVPDGSGGWYIGGEFTAVAGKRRSCLAQVRADGSISDWNPSVTGSPGYIDPPEVSAIAVNGDRVFVGGGFREIGGRPHENLGCVDARTGAVLDWDLDTEPGGWVYALAAYENTTFVGGWFSTIGGQARSCLAAVDATTGVVKPWQADADASVWALLFRGDSLLVGGEFGWIAGGLRSYVAAVDIRTGQLLPLDTHASGMYVQYFPNPRVAALALVGDTLYAAGSFTEIGGQTRSSIAALNVATGEALAWAPDTLGPRYEGFPPPLCETLAVQGRSVYVGGWFDTVGGESRPFVAALSKETGRVTGWNPKPDVAAYALAPKGDTLWVGGMFSLVGDWKRRPGLAAIDLTTGAVKPWNPNPDGIICTAVAVRGDRVFVSGDFANIGGELRPRNHFAALDTLNGEVTDWNPGANSLANVLRLDGDTLYVGGEFTQIGGQPRNSLAAISATTGQVLSWDPNPNSPVRALARSGNTMYIGGLFDHVAGQWRRGIAAVDATTGALAPWNPDTDNSTVEAVLVTGSTVYVGGGFNQIGGRARKSLAAVDAVTGAATDWDPSPTNWDLVTPRVRAMALSDSVLYVGGSFASIGGQPRICLAAVDASTGLARSWDPGLDGLVWSLATDGSTVFAGGGFTRAGGLPAVGLAGLSFPKDPEPVPVSFALTQTIPNPATSSAIIRYALPVAVPVTLSVYDLQGRRVASLLDHVFQGAGRHDVPVQADHWKPGVYLCRLEAGGRSAARKMVIVK
jgi:hypothetical protein